MANTKYNRRARRKTMRKTMRMSVTGSAKANMVRSFLEMLNMIKLYHWKTHSFSQHKATDDLHSKLSENIDKFVEILMGKDSKRIYMVSKNMSMIDSNNIRDFKARMFGYRLFFIEMNSMFDAKKDSDLLNIRDEIVGDINQFLYLLTLNK